MKVCNLSSGSDGNLTYVGTDTTKIVVDMGLSCKESISRLALLGIKPEEIQGILVTHEHMDHIKGIDVFSLRFNTPVYVHEDGYSSLEKKLRTRNIVVFGDSSFEIGDLKIYSIPVSHDVKRCSAYIIFQNDKKLSIVTDIGIMTPEILQCISKSSLVYIESNHDKNLLSLNPRYPDVLKKRILSNQGHLSNIDCASAVYELAKNGTRQIVLSHLSTENNSPELAYKTVCSFLKDYGIVEGESVKIDVATTHPGAIFKI